MSSENRFVICKDEINPDPELLTWEKWIQIRKDETEHLASKTKRTQAELAMNLLENVRKDKEMKTVLEHAKIEKKVGVRKTIWEQAPRLKQKCYSDPVYELQRTRAELGKPRIVEHIGVPRYIQENEKGIKGVQRKRCTKLDFHYNNYKEKREKELEADIMKIDPIRPQIEELCVVGKKPKPLKIKMRPLPTINIISNYEYVRDVLSSVYAIRINDTIFFKDVVGQDLTHLTNMQDKYWHVKCDSWSYYFNCPVNRVGRAKLFLENVGTVSLRYCWKKVNQSNIEDSKDIVFFFNKNENVIYPGQKQELLFTFLSSEPGSYKENWEITFLNVNFFDTQDKRLIVDLHADSVENVHKIKKKVEKLEKMIYNTVLKNMCRDLLRDVFIKATSVEPQIYPYKKLLLEAEIFIMKNPVCFYHQSEVMKMKELFTEMAPDQDWDLAITSWRYTMMDKDFDDRMKFYELLKTSHRECLKPCLEVDNLLAYKYRAVKQLIEQMATKFDEEFARITHNMIAIYDQNQIDHLKDASQVEQNLNIPSPPFVQNIFYIRAYEHVASMIEQCAGVLSSLDLNRWIHFDFCRT